MAKKLEFKEFKERSDKIHDGKYTYYEETYVNTRTKTRISCPIHGDFEQIPHNHLNGQGCPRCGQEVARKYHKHNYEPFLAEVKKRFGDNFSFPLIESQYVNNKTYVTVKCNICGYTFSRRPNDLLSDKFKGCRNCKHIKVTNKRNSKTLIKPRVSNEEYLKRFKEKFGDTITPFMDEYINTQTEIHFKCNKCGYVFKRRPHNCLTSRGCPKCKHVSNQKLTTEEFINRANKIHDNKYDYSNAVYNGTDTLVEVICHEKDKFGDEHGAFKVTPHAHIGSMKSGCPKCSGKFRKDTSYFIKEANLIYGHKYDYSKCQYNGALEKVEIICPTHGSFWITPNDHLNGKGCKRCGYDAVSNKLSMSTDEFLEKAKERHGDKYDYSKVEYIDSQTKVCIICPKHGEFWQSPVGHLRGNGCQKCKQSHLENEIMQFLDGQGIEYETQKKFDWLGKQSLDFYLPKYNVAIECQGKQHFMDTLFGSFEENLKNDEAKKEKCEKHDIKVLYYSNLGIEYPYEVFENKEQLLEKIQENDLEIILTN